MKKQLSIETIEPWLKSINWAYRLAAMEACYGRNDVPYELLFRGLKDENWEVRVAAMKACYGRKDVPLDLIECGLNDDDWFVYQTAVNCYKQKRIKLPAIRTIEPPELVYQKCAGKVIVVATIPKDAQVRGTLNGKCRANKAKIVDVIGKSCGEKVGISFYDRSTTYFVGDKVVIDDFDYSNEVCSTGFHFFCFKELAEKAFSL